MRFKLNFGVLPNIGNIIQNVRSVNSKTGDVVLSAADVGSEPLGAVESAKNQLNNDISIVKNLAEVNQLNLTKKADLLDFEQTQIQVELNRLALLSKADLTALAMLTTLINTKADQVYVQEQIANLLSGDQSIINAIQEISLALKENEDLLEALDYTVANRVRFDIANQALTALQKFNARTNINAEESGTAAMLIAQITAQSLGAATTAQGVKADTALQSADVAPVALSGLFSSLSGQIKIFDVVYGAYQVGSNTALLATDTLGQMLGKLQAQINAGSKAEWVDGRTIGTFFTSATIDSSRSYFEFARKDGELWVRGEIFPVSNQTSNQSYISITDQHYTRLKREPVGNGGHYVCAFNAYQAGIPVVLYAWIRKESDLCNIEIRYLSGTVNSVNNNNPSLNITATSLGKLLNP